VGGSGKGSKISSEWGPGGVCLEREGYIAIE